jgi:hypothetical protein
MDTPEQLVRIGLIPSKAQRLLKGPGGTIETAEPIVTQAQVEPNLGILRKTPRSILEVRQSLGWLAEVQVANPKKEMGRTGGTAGGYFQLQELGCP